MSKASVDRVVKRYLFSNKVAASVDEESAWDSGEDQSTDRNLDPHFDWDPEVAESLAIVLKYTLGALGYTLNAQQRFAKMQSRDMSPDGRLGGRGYVARISNIRRQFNNVVEALSAIQDTLHDEVHAPHWTSEEEEDLQETLEETEEIRKNPSEWAEENIEA